MTWINNSSSTALRKAALLARPGRGKPATEVADISWFGRGKEPGSGSSANGALGLIGRVTGLLTTKPPAQNVAVTKITVVTTADGPNTEVNAR